MTATMRGALLMMASVALLATAACAPRFDMVGEEATSDPVAVKRTGQERRAQ